MGPDLEGCRHSVGDISVKRRAVDCRTFLGRCAGQVLVAMGQNRFHRVGMLPLCELHRVTNGTSAVRRPVHFGVFHFYAKK